ncbi:MFS transporter [Streptomyces leeuwenhoekii]|uniref:MFS transporter n=1 Tax=Streptomyces leeuwenhoekii TaxID=1437453 RepID=UPI0036763851
MPDRRKRADGDVTSGTLRTPDATPPPTKQEPGSALKAPDRGDGPSVPEPKDGRGELRQRPGLPLAVYLTAATLVRSASGGAPVALVALTLARPGHGGAALAGVLAALLTLPNVAGPWMARWLEEARDPRCRLAAAFIVFGLMLAGTGLTLGRLPVVVVGLLVIVGGLCDPLMTGGLSSRLALIVGEDTRAQRRAEGWDSATYGSSNVLGPAAVAAITAVSGALTAVVALGAAGVVAGLLMFALPREHRDAAARQRSMPVRDALGVIVRRGPLRRVMIATMITSVSTGGVMVIAVVFGRDLQGSSGAGAALGAAYGVGNLCGALLTGVFPLTGEPERWVLCLTAANAVAVGLCALAPDYVLALAAFALAGATSAVLFTATLAVRSMYSPPNARAQVFVTMAGLKMAAGSAGTALAGTLAGIGPRLALCLNAAVVVSAVTIALTDLRLTSRRSSDAAPRGHFIAGEVTGTESRQPGGRRSRRHRRVRLARTRGTSDRSSW